MNWRDRVEGAPRWARFVVPAILVLAVILVVVLASGGEDRATVTASDEPSSTTTTDPTTTSTEPTTTTTAPPSTTTTAEPAPTTTVPTTTTTAPPPTTTVPAGPTEFAATVRGQDQGPDYYGIFYGTAFGGGGGFQVSVNCRPGTVTVTVLEDGWVTPQPDNVSYPTRVWIYADETELAYNKGVTDGTVISGQVSSRAFIKTSGPSEQDLRIKYDCRG